MEVLRKITPNKNLALALGYFDGIHLGHKKLITTLVENAKNMNIKSAVVTFDKNPVNYFSSDTVYNIQTYKDREMILEALGVDFLYELDFSQFKDLSAFDYLKNILIDNFSPKLVIAGYNHTFGKDKLGNSAFLKEFSSKFDYECLIIPEQKFNNELSISSTIIRNEIEKANLSLVKSLLGRYFSVRNSVIKGDRIARTFGIPTANLVWPKSMVKLPYGVYFGYVEYNSSLYPALISWGTKPTLTNGEEEVLEAHINDFSLDIYGKIIKVLFVEKIRDQEKFPHINTLKTQLKKDHIAFLNWVRNK